jgi:sugar fermentation stimulation protein A
LVRSDSLGTLTVHVPNPGRMEELLIGGVPGWVVPSGDPRRRTAGTLVSVQHGPGLVSIDTQMPNRLIGRLLHLPGGPGALGFPEGAWRAEITWRESRLDFARTGAASGSVQSLIEVKSANLRVGRVGLFPDAPTQRGTRHLNTLATAARRGIEASVLFAVQRRDVASIGPNRALDPDFGDACDRAARAGVRFGAVRLRVTSTGVALDTPLPVHGIP